MKAKKLALVLGFALLLAGVFTACTKQTPIIETRGYGGGGLVSNQTLVGWEDLRIDATQAMKGASAPTDETGFRGSSSFTSRNLVHNQADGIEFDVQMPHAWDNTDVWPHVHFSPWITNTGTVTVSFILDCFDAAIDGTFPASSTTYTMTKSWTNSGQWKHLLASRATAYTGLTGKGISAVQKCRLFRDNTVTGNLAGKVSLLYLDIHYRTDAMGSSAATSK